MVTLQPSQRDQLQRAILQLMMNRILAAVADMELDRGGRLRISNLLRERLREFSRLVVDDIQDVKRAFPPLSATLLASLDAQTLEAEVQEVVSEIDSQLESILRERDDLKPL